MRRFLTLLAHLLFATASLPVSGIAAEELASGIAAEDAHGWQLGQICNGIDYSSSGTPAEDMLRGKHLRVLSCKFPPHGEPDPDAERGWVGLDVTLLDQVSFMLGFTYEIVDMGLPDNYTDWTSLLLNGTGLPADGSDRALGVDEGDLVASYWLPSERRLSAANMLHGHLDGSVILVARTLPHAATGSTLLNMFSFFFRTFSFWWQLPLVFVIVSLSGLVGWFIERDYIEGARIGESLHEAWAGALFGGFDRPLTRASAFYQSFVSFFFIIITATYTANLAAAIVSDNAPALTAQSMQQIAASGGRLTLCRTVGEAWMARVDAAYPLMPFDIIRGADSLAEALLRGRCDAVVATRQNYDDWRTNSSYCNFKIVDTLFSSQSGWVTSRHNPCVAHAVNWALTKIENNGTLDALVSTEFHVETCASNRSQQIATFESTGTVIEAAPESATQIARRRRLQTTGSAPSADAEEAETSGADWFLGLTLLWLVATLFVTVPTVLSKLGFKSTGFILPKETGDGALHGTAKQRRNAKLILLITESLKEAGTRKKGEVNLSKRATRQAKWQAKVRPRARDAAVTAWASNEVS